MTRIKRAGPPVLVVAVIAAGIGYLFGCTRADREQQSQANANQPESAAPSESAPAVAAADEDDSSKPAETRTPIRSDETGDQVAQNDQPVQAASGGPQFDAPYYEFKKKHGARWAEEDKAIDAKLAAFEKKFGKKPNIVYILVDDIGHGELGMQGGGAARGAPTPNLDQMAREGLLLNAFYSEPSCTPTRTALMTGRHPVRTGLTDVIFPGNPAGLHPEEVTLGEVLSEAGYAPAIIKSLPPASLLQQQLPPAQTQASRAPVRRARASSSSSSSCRRPAASPWCP